MPTLKSIKQVDLISNKLFKKARQITDPSLKESFCNRLEIKLLTAQLLDILQATKPSFRTLTNNNHHTLVKILAYQGYFTKQLDSNTLKELKSLSLI